MSKAPIGIQVQGLKQTIAAARMAGKEAGKVVRQELRDAAGPVVGEMKSRAPKGPAKRTSTPARHLEAAIRSKVISRGVLVGADVPHGAIVHFGKRSTQLSRSGNSYTRRLTPTDWAYSAVDRRREEVRRNLAEALDRSLGAIFKGGS